MIMKSTAKRPHSARKNTLKNQSGFMTAEFLFAFTMVIGSGIIIFALTFSLTTIEIAQYIVWSSARSYAVGHASLAEATTAAENKYKNLTAAFPLLTGNGSDSPWFRMPTVNDRPEFDVGDLSRYMGKGEIDPENKIDLEARHPWYGVQSSIDLILFKGLQVPFLGRITETPDEFIFPVRGLLLRHPSIEECQTFFTNKYKEGIKRINGENWNNLVQDASDVSAYYPIEDNGC